MIILDDIEQGTPEWMAARVGVLSASKFSEIITSKGAESKQSTKLRYQLVEEMFSGSKAKIYRSAAMERGTELEPEARAFFSLVTGLRVDEVGLCYLDEKKEVSCSPDGIIWGREGLEIKCPSLQVHHETIERGILPTEHVAQVQGSLGVTGLERWHFLSYYPGVKYFHIVVERDEIWIAKFSKIRDNFIVELNELHEQLKGV